MGKYLDQAGLSGIYANANPARRATNSMFRSWTDLDGDRILDCDPLVNSATTPECPIGFGSFTVPSRYGRDPYSFDENGNQVALATTQCGLPAGQDQITPPAAQEYCDTYGDSLISGWGRRQGNWQTSIGVQHEILPRLSAEVTYVRRSYFNLQVTDQLGVGCDRYQTSAGGPQDFAACTAGFLNYVNPQYDFYSVTAPGDPDLPGGGGYRVIGLTAIDTNVLTATMLNNNPRAVSYLDSLNYSYNGVDTNFVWRGPGGLRLNGGTSTGRSQRDTCGAEVDGPRVRSRLSSNDASNFQNDSVWRPQCRAFTPFQTRVNGTAAYTIPWVDVLVSTVFQSFPGVQLSANMSFEKAAIQWNPESQDRLTRPCATASNGFGCVDGFVRNDGTTTTINLLNANEMFGQRVTTFDMKLAKNVRFGNKRATFGVDVYNLFNSSAITDYESNFTPDNAATPDVDESAGWNSAESVIAPRFARLSVQFYF